MNHIRHSCRLLAALAGALRAFAAVFVDRAWAARRKTITAAA